MAESILEKLKRLRESQGTTAPASPPSPVVEEAPLGVNPPDAALSPDDLEQFDAPPVAEQPPPESTPKGKRKGKTAAKAGSESGVDPVAVVSEGETFGLLIDAYPVKMGQSVAAEQLLRMAADMVEKEIGMDWRLAEYGKGAPLMLTAFKQVVEQNAEILKGKTLLISSAQPEAGPVLAWLVTRAGFVARGR